MDLKWIQLVERRLALYGLKMSEDLAALHKSDLYALARAEYADSGGESIDGPTKLLDDAIRQVFDVRE